MNDTKKDNRSTSWQGDMCFGILSTKSHSTRLHASVDGLILTGPLGKKFELPSNRIDTIETGKWSIWFLTAMRFGFVQIHHHVDDVPKKLLFTAKGTPCHEVARELKNLGFKVN